MRCCDCEFRSQCDESETVLTAFVSCYKRDQLLEEKKSKSRPDSSNVGQGKRMAAHLLCESQKSYYACLWAKKEADHED